eukprot:7391659-Prymnesium_polylepis.1
MGAAARLSVNDGRHGVKGAGSRPGGRRRSERGLPRTGAHQGARGHTRVAPFRRDRAVRVCSRGAGGACRPRRT